MGYIEKGTRGADRRAKGESAMIVQNLHMHTDWDDGSASCEEMISASRAAGLASVGVSVHCPMMHPSPWSCPKARLPAYRAHMRALKAKYAGEIEVYTGMEWDVDALETELTAYDYVIGSAHEIQTPDGPLALDESAETTARCLAMLGADGTAEAYFAALERVAQEEAADIVGHFDLLTKFDERHGFFDENSPRYRRAAERAMERLVRAGKIFEVNTGAISRGYRTTPYPSMRWLCLLREMNGRVTVGADAHTPSGVVCAFDLAERQIREAGFAEVWILQGKRFVPVSL